MNGDRTAYPTLSPCFEIWLMNYERGAKNEIIIASEIKLTEFDTYDKFYGHVGNIDDARRKARAYVANVQTVLGLDGRIFYKTFDLAPVTPQDKWIEV
jgi:hypothetical protein